METIPWFLNWVLALPLFQKVKFLIDLHAIIEAGAALWGAPNSTVEAGRAVASRLGHGFSRA